MTEMMIRTPSGQMPAYVATPGGTGPWPGVVVIHDFAGMLSGGTRSVNRELEAKARALAGLKGYVTNLQACPDGTRSRRSS